MAEPARPGAAGAYRIDRDGVWHHEGVEVTHPGVLRNLFANLEVDGERYQLRVGPARIPVAVDDTPFVVVRLEAGAARDRLEAHLSDGSHEALVASTLELDPRGVPYCRVKEGRFRARLSVAAWLQLAQWVESDARTGAATLVLGSRRIPLRQPG